MNISLPRLYPVLSVKVHIYPDVKTWKRPIGSLKSACTTFWPMLHSPSPLGSIPENNLSPVAASRTMACTISPVSRNLASIESTGCAVGRVVIVLSAGHASFPDPAPGPGSIVPSAAKLAVADCKVVCGADELLMLLLG
jgi:hypothetical protein